MRLLNLAALALVLATFAACARDGYAELGLVEVTGVVTLDGKPLRGAKVTFESDDNRAAIGFTDAAGWYVLKYDSETWGVTPGKKIVRITMANTDAEGGGAAEGAVVAKETVPARYNVQSELKADVLSAQRTFDFSLKSAP